MCGEIWSGRCQGASQSEDGVGEVAQPEQNIAKCADHS